MLREFAAACPPLERLFGSQGASALVQGEKPRNRALVPSVLYFCNFVGAIGVRERTLALADEFQKLLDSGAVKRRADVATRFKLSRARVTQLLDLHKLHPDIQDFVRNLSGVGDGASRNGSRRCENL